MFLFVLRDAVPSHLEPPAAAAHASWLRHVCNVFPSHPLFEPLHLGGGQAVGFSDERHHVHLLLQRLHELHVDGAEPAGTTWPPLSGQCTRVCTACTVCAACAPTRVRRGGWSRGSSALGGPGCSSCSGRSRLWSRTQTAARCTRWRPSSCRNTPACTFTAECTTDTSTSQREAALLFFGGVGSTWKYCADMRYMYFTKYFLIEGRLFSLHLLFSFLYILYIYIISLIL